MAFSVTSRQQPQKCSLDFDKDDWAICHSEFRVFKCENFEVFTAILRASAPQVGCNKSNTSLSVSSGVPNTRKKWKPRGVAPRFLLFSSIWSPLMKQDKRVFDFASQPSMILTGCLKGSLQNWILPCARGVQNLFIQLQTLFVSKDKWAKAKPSVCLNIIF